MMCNVANINFIPLTQTIWDSRRPCDARSNTLLSAWTSSSSKEYYRVSSWGIWVLWRIPQLPLSIYLLQASIRWPSLWRPVTICIHDNFQVSLMLVQRLCFFFFFFSFLVVTCLLAYDARQWIFPVWSLQFNVHHCMWFCWWVHGCNIHFIPVQAYFTLQGSLTRDLRPGNIYPRH